MFNEDSDPINDLNIGIKFGFTHHFKDLHSNDGETGFYLNTPAMNKFCSNPSANINRHHTAYLIEDFNAFYNRRNSRKYLCKFYFRRTNDRHGNEIWKALGTSGSHGFHGGQYTIKDTLCKTYVKQCLEQIT